MRRNYCHGGLLPGIGKHVVSFDTPVPAETTIALSATIMYLHPRWDVSDGGEGGAFPVANRIDDDRV